MLQPSRVASGRLAVMAADDDDVTACSAVRRRCVEWLRAFAVCGPTCRCAGGPRRASLRQWLAWTADSPGRAAARHRPRCRCGGGVAGPGGVARTAAYSADRDHRTRERDAGGLRRPGAA